MNGIIVEFPWYSRVLSPNVKSYYMKLAKHKKLARQDAFVITSKACGRLLDAVEKVCLEITFHPPDRRRRDMDNNLASIKALIDGISDATKIDDSMFDYTLKRGDVIKGGLISITIRAVKIVRRRDAES